VCHFGPIVAAIQRAARLTAVQAFAHKVDNLSLTEIAVTPDGWHLVRANHRA
jgi:alpha-ribazole phosphatase